MENIVAICIMIGLAIFMLYVSYVYKWLSRDSNLIVLAAKLLVFAAILFFAWDFIYPVNSIYVIVNTKIYPVSMRINDETVTVDAGGYLSYRQRGHKESSRVASPTGIDEVVGRGTFLVNLSDRRSVICRWIDDERKSFRTNLTARNSNVDPNNIDRPLGKGIYRIAYSVYNITYLFDEYVPSKYNNSGLYVHYAPNLMKGARKR